LLNRAEDRVRSVNMNSTENLPSRIYWMNCEENIL
jgi:hypothetical protein